jgi:5-formyltetrahydrofolate cyclo-ligase
MSSLNPTPTLRKELRLRRKALPSAVRRRNEYAIARRLVRLPIIQRSRRLGLYLSEDGEVDLTLVQQYLSARGKRLYLPVLHPSGENRLWFSAFVEGARLIPNRFGIDEPDVRKFPPVKLRCLDAILMPLVGFDAEMNRMGMGGGFYDRTFSFLRKPNVWRKPRLIGIAHDCQRLATIECRPWDVPMDRVVTERAIYIKRRIKSGKIGKRSLIL